MNKFHRIVEHLVENKSKRKLYQRIDIENEIRPVNPA